ncbi:MAG: sulfotransferase [Pseudomonadota bacterium]
MTLPSTSAAKIFGIGFNKTGTSTLGRCFDILGIAPVARPQMLHDSFQSDSFRQFFPGPAAPPVVGKYSVDSASDPFGEWPYRSICDEIFDHRNQALAIEIATHFRAFHDRPWNVKDLYQTLDHAFPGSFFILTWRDPEAWWRSTERWLGITHPDDHAKLERYYKHLDTDNVDKERFIAGYLAHNADVRRYFGSRTDFLDINFEHGDGWERLCRFLGVPVPDCPFPHENKQRYRA